MLDIDDDLLTNYVHQENVNKLENMSAMKTQMYLEKSVHSEQEKIKTNYLLCSSSESKNYNPQIFACKDDRMQETLKSFTRYLNQNVNKLMCCSESSNPIILIKDMSCTHIQTITGKLQYSLICLSPAFKMYISTHTLHLQSISAYKMHNLSHFLRST